MAKRGTCELWDTQGRCLQKRQFEMNLPQTEEKLYQRGKDGYPIGSDQVMREGLGPIPDENQPFWSGKGFIKPSKIYGWGFNTDYNEWRAYVLFPDGTKTWTSPKHRLHPNLPQTRKYYAVIKDAGDSYFAKGALVPYEEFEAERARVLERGGRPPSIQIRFEEPGGNGNGNGSKLPQTIEIQALPDKFKELRPFIDAPLPPTTDFLPATVPDEGGRKIDVVLQQLKDGVEGIQSSAQFRLFLDTMSKFHDYSVGNLILIGLQKPEATRVAGFNTWKDLGRWVRKGERGIAILAPVMPAKQRKELAEEEEEEILPQTPVYFKVVHVFDVSQTDGKELPEFEVPVLTGEANEELFQKVLVLAQSQNVDVSFQSRPEQDPGIKGMYSGKTIWVRPEESRAQQLKTLLHEMSHYYSEGVFHIPRRDAETIAESAAYAVGAHFGFDTGVRSFPYVALWAQDKKVLAANLASIRKVADTIMHSLQVEKVVKAAAPVYPRPQPTKPGNEMEFIADSPELLAYTIEDIGYREKLDNAFQTAIARVKGK